MDLQTGIENTNKKSRRTEDAKKGLLHVLTSVKSIPDERSKVFQENNKWEIAPFTLQGRPMLLDAAEFASVADMSNLKFPGTYGNTKNIHWYR